MTPPEGGGPLEGAGEPNLPPDMQASLEAEDILGPVADTFRGIGKIKGQVFLGGDIWSQLESGRELNHDYYVGLQYNVGE